MKRTLLLPLCLLALAPVVLVLGCTNQKAAPVNGPKVEGPKSQPEHVRLASDLLRQPGDLSHLRDALQLLNPYFDGLDVRDRLQLKEQPLTFLRKDVGLTEEEMAEVQAGVFRPADAYYLEECFLLHDVARRLGVPGSSTADLARHCFAWVARNVALQEQGDDWLPVAYVLKRGYGSAGDRTRVLLALLRQMKSAEDQPMNGCALVLPGADSTPVLVGVFDRQTENILLFDPRLGEPILKGNAVASLKDVRQDPKLLAPARLTPEQAKELQAWLACPLQALSPRMAELERLLLTQDTINLHLDPIALTAEARQFAGPVSVRIWNPPGSGASAPNSPTRVLRRFLPPEEGGTDRTKRLQQFNSHLVPWPRVLLGLTRLRLSEEDLAAPAHKVLVQLAATLFEKYYLQPHEALLRGEYAKLIERLDRIRPFLEDDSLAGLAESREFQKEVASWRERINNLYRAQLVAKDPRAQGMLNAAWSEDQFLASLLQVESERQDQRFKKEVLTRIIACVTRDTLTRHANWLSASVWQEKAARAEAVARAGGRDAAAARSAEQAWLNARGFWTLYLSRAAVTPDNLAGQLAPIQTFQARNPEIALNLLEDLHLDLVHSVQARFHLAEATRQIEGAGSARASLQTVADELQALEKDGALAKAVAELQNAVGRTNSQALQRRADLLARNWAADGSFAWLRREAAGRLARLP